MTNRYKLSDNSRLREATGIKRGDTVGLDKDFFPMGNRRWDETLLPSGVHQLPADSPVRVDGLTGADILIPALLEERRLAFTPRQGGRHGVHHYHLTDAAGEVPAEDSGQPAREKCRVLDVGNPRDHIPRPPQRSDCFRQGLGKQGALRLTGLLAIWGISNEPIEHIVKRIRDPINAGIPDDHTVAPSRGHGRRHGPGIAGQPCCLPLRSPPLPAAPATGSWGPLPQAPLEK